MEYNNNMEWISLLPPFAEVSMQTSMQKMLEVVDLWKDSEHVYFGMEQVVRRYSDAIDWCANVNRCNSSWVATYFRINFRKKTRMRSYGQFGVVSLTKAYLNSWDYHVDANGTMELIINE